LRSVTNYIFSPDAAIGYGLDDQGLISGKGRNFAFHDCVQTSSEKHSASYPIGTGLFAQEVKWLKSENNCKPATSTKVKNA
jgi:hypothetical protein